MGSGRTIKVADTSSMKRVKKGVIYGVLMLNLFKRAFFFTPKYTELHIFPIKQK